MVLPRSGVELVAENFSQYIKKMADAAKAAIESGKSAQYVTAQLMELSKMQASAGRYTKAFIKEINAQTEALDKLGEAAKKAGKETSTAAGGATGGGGGKENILQSVMSSLGGGGGLAAIGSMIGTAVGGPLGIAIGAAIGLVISKFNLKKDFWMLLGVPGGIIKGFITLINIIKTLNNIFATVRNAIIKGAIWIVKNGIQLIWKAIQITVDWAIKLGKALWNIGTAIAKAGIGVAKTAFDALGKVIKFAISPLQSFAKWLANVASTAAGMMLRDLFNNIGKSIRSAADAMWEGAANLMWLRVRFEGLIATEISTTYNTMSFADAMGIASIQAEELLSWINQMALVSPFTRDEVADTTALGMALGFTEKEAKDMTSALIDWASGMALPGDRIEQILYNFGQMRTQMKLTGQELRDAARGGLIPVNEILKQMATELGKTGAAFKEFISDPVTAGADVKRFFEIFIEMAEKRFPTAAKRLSETWQGVTKNIKMFFSAISGAGMLEPLINAISKRMAEFLKILTSPEVAKAAKNIGQALTYAFTQIMKGVDAVSLSLQSLMRNLGITLPTLESFIAAIRAIANIIRDALYKASNFIQNFALNSGQQFKKMATNWLTWGWNVASQFALGLLKGAQAAIVGVMNFISKLLAAWLGPGSPPKVAKGIRIWGMKAFEEFLKGFTDADYEVLNSLQSAIKSAIDRIVSAGGMTAQAGTNLFKSLSMAIAKALAAFEKTGKMPTDLFARLGKSLGPFGKAIAELAKRRFELLAATLKLAAAEKALAAAQERQKRATATVNKLLKEYNAMLRAGASKADLAAKLKGLNVAEREQDLSNKAVSDAQAKRDALEKALQPLEDAVKLQEELIANMMEFAEAAKDAGAGIDDVTKEIAEAIKAADDAYRTMMLRSHFAELMAPLPGEFPLVTGLPLAETQIQGWIEMQLRLAQQKFDNWWALLWYGEPDGIYPTLDRLKTSVGWTALTTDIGLFKTAITDLGTGITTGLGSIDWKTITEGGKGLWDDFLKFIATTDWTAVGISIGTFFKGIVTNIQDFISGIDKDKLDKLGESIQLVVGQFLILVDQLTQEHGGEKESIGDTLAGITNAAITAITLVTTWIAGVIGIANFIVGVVTSIAGIKDTIETSFNTITMITIPTFIQDVKDLFSGKNFVDVIAGIFYTAGQGWVKALGEGAKSASGLLGYAVHKVVYDAMCAIIKWLNDSFGLNISMPSAPVDPGTPPPYVPPAAPAPPSDFQEGGVVPGPVGKASLAVVHGGEEVIPVKVRERYSGNGTLVNTPLVPRSSVLNIGVVNINSNMDMALFTSKVKRIMRGEV